MTMTLRTPKADVSRAEETKANIAALGSADCDQRGGAWDHCAAAEATDHPERSATATLPRRPGSAPGCSRDAELLDDQAANAQRASGTGG